MPVKLTGILTRETDETYNGTPIVLSVSNMRKGGTALQLRLKGTQVRYIIALSELLIYMALNHGLKEANARRDARRNHISWKVARREFQKQNDIRTIAKHESRTKAG